MAWDLPLRSWSSVLVGQTYLVASSGAACCSGCGLLYGGTVRFVGCVSATKERSWLMTVGSLLNRYFRYNDRFGISIWPVAVFLRAPAAGCLICGRTLNSWPSLGSSLPSAMGGGRVNILGLSAVARSTGQGWRDHGCILSFTVGRRGIASWV